MSVNQYNTRCTVDICKNGRVINIKHFSDLQMAYLWVQSQVPEELLDHRGEFLKTFEYVIEKMLQYPSDGVVVGQTETTIYDLYFTEM
jgi:hypothetical protein